MSGNRLHAAVTDAWLANKDWIIFSSSRKDLNYATNFFISTNNRVKLLLLSKVGKVTTVFF